MTSCDPSTGVFCVMHYFFSFPTTRVSEPRGLLLRHPHCYSTSHSPPVCEQTHARDDRLQKRHSTARPHTTRGPTTQHTHRAKQTRTTHKATWCAKITRRTSTEYTRRQHAQRGVHKACTAAGCCGGQIQGVAQPKGWLHRRGVLRQPPRGFRYPSTQHQPPAAPAAGTHIM